MKIYTQKILQIQAQKIGAHLHVLSHRALPLCALLLINSSTVTHTTLVSLKPAAQASADTLNATDIIQKLKKEKSAIKTGDTKTLSELAALFAKDSTYAQAEKIIGHAYNHAGIESAALKAAHNTIETLRSRIANLNPIDTEKNQRKHQPVEKNEEKIHDIHVLLASLKENRAALHQEYLLDPIKRTAKNVVDTLEDMAAIAIPLITQKLKTLDSQQLDVPSKK